MSQLSDYSKFDHIDSDVDSVEETSGISPGPSPPPTIRQVTVWDVTKKRYAFQVEDQTIYEWNQSIDEVCLFVPRPPMLQSARQLLCHIAAKHLQLGLRNASTHEATLYLDESFPHPVDVSESTWVLEEDCIVIHLCKANQALIWESPLVGRVVHGQRVQSQLSPIDVERERETILRERWQQEHPGMDFSGAVFNGSAPDPRTFMGGVSYR